MPDTIAAEPSFPHDSQLNTIDESNKRSEARAQSHKPEDPDSDPAKDLLDRLRLAQANIALVDPGLARTIQNLIDRGADPERRAQPGFRTGLAYALQDLEKLGIGPIAIAPELRVEMSRLAATAPGLENERMRALLRATPEIADRRVVHDIRSAARDIAKLADQHTPDVESRIDVLENRIRLAPRQTADQTVRITSEAKTSHTAARSDPGLSSPSQSTPANEHRTVRHSSDPTILAQQPPPPSPPGVRVKERSGFAIDMVLGKMRQPETKSPGLADPAYTPIGSRLSAFEEMIQAGRDERAFERAERSGRAVLDALNSFSKGEGASILSRIREAAKHEPGGMASVLSEMRDGGRFADLRTQFNNALETERGFAAAYNQAAAALGRYGQDRSAVQDIIARRHDAEMLAARFERLDAKIGETASETPGRREGESMLQEMADKAAEILHRAIDAVKAAFRRSPFAQAAPSPSMSA